MECFALVGVINGRVYVQLPLFETPSTWVAPSNLPNWDGAKRIGIDIETYDPYLKKLGPSVRRGGFIAGVSFALEDGPAHYLPVRHEGGGNLDIDMVLSYLRDQARSFKGTIVGANFTYDLDYLAEAGVEFPNVEWVRDVQIADPIINELHNSYRLQAISERWSLPGKDETLLNEACANWGIKKGDMWRLPAKYVGEYAEHDARLPLLLLRKQERVIDDEGLWDIYNLESKVQPVVLRMRRHGIRIDLDQLERVRVWALKEEQEALTRIKQATGVNIPVDGVWAKEGIVAALRYIGAVLKETPTGQPMIDKDVLAEIDHPVANDIARARKVNKLRTTFVESIHEHRIGDRIHCTFNQMRRTKDTGDSIGARYGRLSSEHPNIQQQPSRDDFAQMWRSIYVPDHPGQEWACMDYSQQEPRMLTHFAEMCRLDGAFKMADTYRKDPKADNHDMMTQLCYPGSAPGNKGWKQKRNQCKDIYLGLCYGMGSALLAHTLRLPTKHIVTRSGQTIEVAGDEAQAILDKFNQRAPFIKQLARRCEETARKRGYITTVLGRRCRFPTKPDGSYDWCHKALNRLIQGSSADQTKEAMVKVDAAGFLLQLQNHDELDTSIDSRRQAEDIAGIMRTCVELNVPSKVDVEIGPSWGEVQ
jgi:DNA polymerase I-like protein with 3'-5' exonuclease and polymerase domains